MEGKKMEEKDQVENPVLLIVDMQNDFVRPGAPLEVPDALLTIPTDRKSVV